MTQICTFQPHAVNAHAIKGPFSEGMETVYFGMGCFWGAERRYWELEGVYSTAVGYAGGQVENPTYKEVCGHTTGHAEVVMVVYDPCVVSYDELMRQFCEHHDPTQINRQHGDVGPNYRSCVFCTTDEQVETTKTMLAQYEESLLAAGYPKIATEVRKDVPFFYAEDYHQQYLHKNPDGYCGLKGTGVCYIKRQPKKPTPTATAA